MLPNFFIVGAPRSGTTSMYNYLSQHPEIFMAERKESHHFAREFFPNHFNGPGDERIFNSMIRDRKEYESQFKQVDQETAVGESSVFYLYYSRTAEAILSECPDAKIIIMLRDPAHRAYSAYMNLVRDSREKLNFKEAIGEEQRRIEQNYEPIWFFKAVGLYYQQVKHYMEVFGEENVKVVLFDDFKADPKSVLDEIFSFLNVNRKVELNLSRQYNKSGIPSSKALHNVITNPAFKGIVKKVIPNKKYLRSLAFKVKDMNALKTPPLDPEAERILKRYFEEDLSKLEILLGKDLSLWKKETASVKES